MLWCTHAAPTPAALRWSESHSLSILFYSSADAEAMVQALRAQLPDYTIVTSDDQFAPADVTLAVAWQPPRRVLRSAGQPDPRVRDCRWRRSTARSPGARPTSSGRSPVRRRHGTPDGGLCAPWRAACPSPLAGVDCRHDASTIGTRRFAVFPHRRSPWDFSVRARSARSLHSAAWTTAIAFAAGVAAGRQCPASPVLPVMMSSMRFSRHSMCWSACCL